MKILIKEPDHRAIRIWLPTWLILNRPAVALWFAFGGGMTASLPCTRQQIFALIKTLRACRRQFPGWTLVEVHSANGEHVEITL